MALLLLRHIRHRIARATWHELLHWVHVVSDGSHLLIKLGSTSCIIFLTCGWPHIALVIGLLYSLRVHEMHHALGVCIISLVHRLWHRHFGPVKATIVVVICLLLLNLSLLLILHLLIQILALQNTLHHISVILLLLTSKITLITQGTRVEIRSRRLIIIRGLLSQFFS